jgi:beta-ureidopropionase / N-carbamoyl-L-amino-acid hydrolase
MRFASNALKGERSMSGHDVQEQLRVDAERVRRTLQAFARIGYDTGGRMQRLAFSRADLRARQLLLHMMQRLGLRTRVDGFGNVFGRLELGDDRDRLAPVLIGSHLDTVPAGGRFDGSLGVAAALEAVALMRQDIGDMKRPVEVVSFACEESSRFGRGTLGSGLLAGAWKPGELLSLKDREGRTLADVLRRVGLDPDRLDEVRKAPGEYAGFIEIHIEQGRVLEESPAQVGVVTAIAAPVRFRVTVSGQNDHSGATPMNLRRDALAAAAEIVLAVESCAREEAEIVGTVGVMRVEPGAINVVPGHVEMGIDIRGTDRERRGRVADSVRRAARETSVRRAVDIEFEELTDEDPVDMSEGIIEALESVAGRRSVQVTRMPSGAGHDAMQMTRICPSGMLLVPSRAGISHDPGEWTDLPDIVAGTQVYVDAAYQLACRT